ncbi:alpha/beta hydrolase, partial [Thermodesulfobacteriota bacterium]
GAGLALHLAARTENLAGVFAVSTPLRLQYLSAKFAPAVDGWNRLMEKLRLDGVKKEFVENKPENPEINYSRNPVSGVRELERLMEAVEPLLRTIKIPALAAQAHGDPVVDPKGSERIFELIGSENKEYILYNFSRHGILRGENSERVHRGIANFVEKLTH